jgi:hypothetical protein
VGPRGFEMDMFFSFSAGENKTCLISLRNHWELYSPQNITVWGLEHLHSSSRLGPRGAFFSSGRRNSAQSRPRFLVFVRIWP